MKQRTKRYTSSKELALQEMEKQAATDQAKRRQFAPWDGKDEPSFEVETPWDGKE